MKSVKFLALAIILMLLVMTPALAETSVIEFEPGIELISFNTDLLLEHDSENEKIINKEPIFPKQNIDNGWFPFRWRPSDWSRNNSILQKSVVVFIMADWLQTRYIASNPDQYEEANPILGPNPSLGEVDRYFACCLVGNTLIAFLLPQKFRLRWQTISLSMQVGTVNHNYNMGVKMSL